MATKKTMEEILAEAKRRAQERLGRSTPASAPVPGREENAYRVGEALLDSYMIRSEAIKGGMGAVWRVHHKSWNTDLAMKRPQAKCFDSEESKAGFIRECDAWIRLGLHPNIVSCYYVREIDGVPTVFSEWMDNDSLKNHILRGTLYAGTAEEQQERLLDIAIQFARGLHYAHERGLIHQDVKPHNLLLNAEWDAKVADFGLSRARSHMTRLEGSATVGENSDPEGTVATPGGGYTLAYASPEQLNSQLLTRRTDIYSWAVSVMEMYLGERLWGSGTAAGSACRGYFSHCRVPMPEALQTLLIRCMEQREEQRPRDFAAVEAELLTIYTETTGKSYPRPAPKAAADTAESLNNRALSYLDLGDRAEAERLFEAAVAANPRELRSVYNRALFLWRSGKLTDAEALAQVSAVVKSGDETGERCLEQLRAESGTPAQLRYSHPADFTIDTLHASQENTVGWHQDSGSLVLLSPQGSRSFRLQSRIMFGIGREEMGFDGNNCNLALSLSGEKKISVMSLRNGSTLTSFTPCRTDIIVVAVALCKTRLAYAMGDGEICLCDIFGRPYRRVKYTDVPGRVSCLQFSRDGTTLAVGYSAPVKSYNSRQSIHVLDVESGELRCTLPLGDASYDLRLRDDTLSVWSGKRYSRWSIAEGKELWSFEPKTAKTGVSCLSQDGRYILIARDASVSEIWDSEERRCIRTIKLPALPTEPGHLTTGEIRALAFPEGMALISGYNGVFGYEITEDRPAADWMLCVITDYRGASQAEAQYENLLEQARKAARSDLRGALKLIAEARSIKGYENHPSALALKAELYATARRGECTIHNVFRRAVVTGGVTAMAMDDMGRYCAVIRDGTVSLLGVPDFNEIARPAFSAPSELALSGNGRYLLMGSEDEGRIGCYDTQKGCLLWEAELELSEICALALNADGSLGLLQYDMCRLLVFEPARCNVLYNRREPTIAFNKVCFTPDGKQLAVASNGGKGTEYNDIEFYTAEDFRLKERIRGVAKGGMNGMAFPKQTDAIFASSWDRHIYLAERKSARREGLQWHDYAPTALCAMADGSHVVSGDQEGIICLYKVLPEPNFDFTLHSELPADRIQLSDDARYMAVMSYGRQAALYELDLNYQLPD